MTRDQAITEFRTLVARYGSAEWLGDIPVEVFERMIVLTQILVDSDKG